MPLLDKQFPNLNPRWLALRLMDGNESIYQSMNQYLSPEQSQSLTEIATHIPLPLNKEQIRDHLTEVSYAKAEQIKNDYVYTLDQKQLARERDLKIDRVITSRWFGIPLMLLLLLVIFWLTIVGANGPSQLLANFFSWGRRLY